jgi:CheY-like chemotaxis protein/anti-sigma regulatory factor (Ser/Thr protein kinase)
VHSDPVLVELILRNLVSNAVRYTERGGVLLACRRRGADVWLEVWDTGIGIEPHHRQAIFREFHQLGNSERDRRKGLGLGLAITEGLVRVLGHELTLLSTPGRGSVFRLRLPLADVPIIRDDFVPHSEPVAGALSIRVLVIDDDETVRVGMQHLLRDWGCECETAETIEQALALARVNPPQLLISDFRLREQRTGAEAIAALRAEIGEHLPALLITGDTAPERLRAARASGVLLLHKPVSPSQLYQRMVSALASSAAEPVVARAETV